MCDHRRISFDRLYGGMTTDYFAFFCPNCSQELTGLIINEEFSVYVGRTRCHRCNETFEFKIAKWQG